MIDIQKRLAYKKAKQQIIPGTYSSVVTNVDWSAKHGGKKAFEISYNVTCGEAVISYKEYFLNDNQNHRTMDFLEYLDKHGFKDPADFIGHIETLTFDDVEAANGNTYLNIVKREFIR